MANDMQFQGGVPTDPTLPVPDTDEPILSDHEAPPGMDPGRDPLGDDDRPEDWQEPPADDDMPPADEPTPLSDDRR